MSRIIQGSIILLLAMVFSNESRVYAQVPETLNYQGYLTDSSGQPLLDSVVVEFAIYTSEMGGVPIWSEFQSVFPTQGLVSSSLGNTANPFPPGMFNTPLYLGIKVSTDDEMTPRIALSSTAYSIKSLDSETLNGRTSFELDQASDIAQLEGELVFVDDQLASLTGSVSGLSSNLANSQADIASLQSTTTTLASDLDNVGASLNQAENTISNLESEVSGKQERVTGTCPLSTVMNGINENGTVNCSSDDFGPWLSNTTAAYMNSGRRVGLGTSNPAAMIQIDSPVDVDPFRARVANATKLRVHQNGSVSAGSSSAGPENGLYVFGDTGIGATNPGAKLAVTDADWQLELRNNGLGGSNWFMGGSSDAWAAGSGKFVLSATANSSSAAFVIDANENVGISAVSPSTKLHVGAGSDVSASSGGYITVGTDSSTNIAIDNNEIMARNNGSVATLALNAEGGKVTVNSGGSQDSDALEVKGRVIFDNGGNSGMRITGTNSNPTNALFEPTEFEEGLVGGSVRPFWRMYSREFYAQSALQYRTYSDRTLKSKIAPIESAIEKIKALEGVTYELSTSPMGQRKRSLTPQEQFVNDHQIGFIAQDVAKVLPQLVTEDESSGLKTVAYMGVIPVLVEALKEQQLQLEAQRAEIDELKSRLK